MGYLQFHESGVWSCGVLWSGIQCVMSTWDGVRNAKETDTDEAQLHQSRIVQGIASEFTWFSRVLYSGRMFWKGRIILMFFFFKTNNLIGLLFFLVERLPLIQFESGIVGRGAGGMLEIPLVVCTVLKTVYPVQGRAGRLAFKVSLQVLWPPADSLELKGRKNLYLESISSGFTRCFLPFNF